MTNRKHVWFPKKFVESSNVPLFFRKSNSCELFFEHDSNFDKKSISDNENKHENE